MNIPVGYATVLNAIHSEQAATNYMIFFLLWFIVVCLSCVPDNFIVQQLFYGKNNI